MPTQTKHKIKRSDVSVANYVYETKNYDLFVLNECNRDFRCAKHLEESMHMNGFIDSGAIHVQIRSDGKLLIMRGHHRFKMAMKMDLPIKFIVDDSDISIFELEADTRSAWNQYDFITGYAKSGNTDYQNAVTFAEKHGYSLTLAACLLSNNYVSFGNKTQAIRKGTYKITETKNARKTGYITDVCKDAGVQFATNTNFVLAVATCCLVDEFIPERFMRRIQKAPNLLKKAGTKKEYMQSIQDAYNSRTKASEQIPLLFYAEQITKKRNVIKNAKK